MSGHAHDSTRMYTYSDGILMLMGAMLNSRRLMTRTPFCGTPSVMEHCIISVESNDSNPGRIPMGTAALRETQVRQQDKKKMGHKCPLVGVSAYPLPKLREENAPI